MKNYSLNGAKNPKNNPIISNIIPKKLFMKKPPKKAKPIDTNPSQPPMK